MEKNPFDKTPKVLEFIRIHGTQYRFVREVPGKGICGLVRFPFGVVLYYDIGLHNAGGAYHFDDLLEALVSLANWKGGSHPGGNWIKHNWFEGEYRNPEYDKDFHLNTH